MEDIIDIIVTETTNLIEITSQPTDEVIDVNIIDNREDITLNVTPTLVEININSLTGNFGVEWGDINGTLSNQTDLQNALNLKADLVDGKVPSSQLPSYVDDVIEVATYSALPATGEVGKIYVVLDTNLIYRWSGSAYIEIKDSSAVWGAITGTLSSQTDLQSALNAKFNNPTGDTTQYIAGDGSLITFPVAGQAGTLVREVRNTTGATLTKGTIVYISGATGNKPTVSKAIATGDSTSAQTFGMCQADISNNSNGYVVCVGDITGLDTSALSEGVQLYLSSTTAGTYTTTKQLAPAHLVYIGVVTRSHPTQGQIEVKIQNGYELDEIHDVAISSKANNDGLFYESSTSLWKNKSIATVLGYSPEQPLTFSSPLSRSTNTVSIPAATSSANGYLTSTDWTTFNGKQAALSGTGFVKISGTTISYDNSTYLTTSSAASTYLALSGGTLTGAVTGTRLVLVQNSADIALSIVQTGAGRGLSVLGTSYFSSDISFGSLSNGILKANTLGGLVLATAGTDYQAPLSGTGFVKSTGGTISYDTSTYALDSAVVKLTGDQNIDGNKEFILPTTFRLGIGLKNPDGIYNYISSINSGWKINTNNKEHQLLFSTSTAYTYTFPSATGTIALTSNLSSYLPLAGGTLTGALNGTSALFSGAVRANNPSEGATGEGLIAGQSFKIDGTGTSQKAVMYMVSNVLSDTYASGLTAQFANFAGDKGFGFNLNTSGGYELYVKNSTWNKALTIANTGAATFSSSVTTGGDVALPDGNSLRIGGQLIANRTSNEIRFGSGTAADYLVYYAGASEKMRITSAGNVGIGTTSPNALLHLTQNATNLNLYLQNTNGSGKTWAVNSDNLGSFNIHDTTANRLTITTGGNVGIGTTAPITYQNYRYLQIDGGSTTQGGVIRLRTSDGSYVNEFAVDSSGGYISSSSIFQIYAGSSNPSFYIKTNGQILINTTTANAVTGAGSLQVNKEIVSMGTSAFIGMQNRASTNFFGIYGDTNLFVYNSAIGTIGTFNATTGIYAPVSDINKKKDLEDSNIGLSEVLQLKPTLYRMKSDSNISEKQLGFIAQDVKGIIPSAYQESGDFIGLNFNPIVAALTKAVQELKAELDTLKNK